jgi:5-hydroxyisourate hydrolase-like protein (transthyretin family)
VSDAATGLPLADVDVNIYTCAGTWLAGGLTDASGAYTTPSPVPAGTYYARTWNLIGYIDEVYDDATCLEGGSSCLLTRGTPVRVTEGTTTTGIDFALNRGGRLTGTVTDAATTVPLAGTSIYIYDMTGRSVVPGESTDAAGAYTSGALPPGNYYARTSNTLGYLDELYNNVTCAAGSCALTAGTPVAVAAGADTTVDFGLVPGGLIAGTVTDAATGQPLSGVSVYIYNSGGTRVALATTDASGVYTSATGLPTGSYKAHTRNSLGYLDEVYDGVPCPLHGCTIGAGTPISVTLGATTAGVDFTLTPGARISGTVTDSGTSLPVAGVSVVIYDTEGTRVVATGSTNSSGVYTSSTGLPTGTYYARTSNSKGYVDALYAGAACPGGLCTPSTGTPINVAAGVMRPGIDFGLAMGGRVSGTVAEAATGLPVAAVQVHVYDSAGSRVTSVYTDCGGVYTTSTGLPAGGYRVRTSNTRGYLDEQYDDVPCPGGTCPVAAGTPVAVSLGATTTGVDFVLAKGGLLSGTVRDAFTGLPLRGVEVHVHDAAGLVTSGSTDNAGVYTSSSGLPTGTYYVRTSNAQGYVDELYDDAPCPAGACTPASGTPVAVTAGTTTTGIDFGLAAGGRISGTVTDAATGLPLLSGVQVRIYDSAGSQVTLGSTNSAGEYTSNTGLPTGTYYARTDNSLGYVDELYGDIPCPAGACTVTGGAAISVVKGSTRTGIDFALSRGGGISGTVTDDETTLPLGGVDVDVHDAGGTRVASARTNVLGGYTSTNALAPGTYYVRTSSARGYFDELYDDKPCPGGTCTVTAGTPVAVASGATTTGIDFALAPNPGLDFYTLTPCRVVDTRDPNGPLGGPILEAGSARSFTVAGPKCGIPATAKAVSVNVTVTGATQNGNVRLYPAGTPTPTTSTINYVAGVTRANNATIALNASGETAVLASPSGSVHFILDVNGYYQ